MSTKVSKKGKAISEAEKKELILQGLVKKKECEDKALKIVERLIEPGIDKEWLRDSAQFITESHYRDVVDERFCIKLCGFPTCSQALGVIPKQQFKISTKVNKVFDITERKKFCSDNCYRQSTYFQSQLLTSPLWLRDEDEQKRVVFVNEVADNQKPRVCEGGGQAVDLRLEAKARSKADVGEFGDSSDEAANRDENFDNGEGEEVSSLNMNDLADLLENDLDDRGVSDSVLEEESKPVIGKQSKPTQKKRKPRAVLTHKPHESADQPRIDVEKHFRDWYTLNTVEILYGKEFVKKMLKEGEVEPEEVRDRVDEEEAMEVEERLKRLAIAQEETKDRTDKDKVMSFLVGAKEAELNVEENSTVDPPREPVLPKLDSSARQQRISIVMEQLVPATSEVLEVIGLGVSDVIEIVRKLVHSFSFNSQNIVMRPQAWTYAAIAILRMSALVDDGLKKKLEEDNSRKYFCMLLMGYETEVAHVDAFIEDLCSKNVKSLPTKE